MTMMMMVMVMMMIMTDDDNNDDDDDDDGDDDDDDDKIYFSKIVHISLIQRYGKCFERSLSYTGPSCEFHGLILKIHEWP